MKRDSRGRFKPKATSDQEAPPGRTAGLVIMGVAFLILLVMYWFGTDAPTP
jgi:hypothetical protein